MVRRHLANRFGNGVPPEIARELIKKPVETVCRRRIVLRFVYQPINKRFPRKHVRQSGDIVPAFITYADEIIYRLPVQAHRAVEYAVVMFDMHAVHGMDFHREYLPDLRGRPPLPGNVRCECI